MFLLLSNICISLTLGILFLKYISFVFNFLFHNSKEKFDRQIIVSNQINQIESWRKCRCCAWVQKRVCHHSGLNSQPGHGTAYQWSELSVIPLSFSGTPYWHWELNSFPFMISANPRSSAQSDPDNSPPQSKFSKLGSGPARIASQRWNRCPGNTKLWLAQGTLTHLFRKGKYHCLTDLLFDWFGFDPTC